jgi:hypothetical protein
VHTQATARDTLKLLWANHGAVTQAWDISLTDNEDLRERWFNDPQMRRDERVALWLARQGYIVSIWNLWESYSSEVCAALPCKQLKQRGQSHTRWVAQCFELNGKTFLEEGWFFSASGLRNLITHWACRIEAIPVGDKPEDYRSHVLLSQAKNVFPAKDALVTFGDRYVLIDHEVVADLTIQVEMFIDAHPL